MIDSIEINNFKSIRELDLTLKPINVLIGANGVGKTNFIGFFKLLNVLYKDELQKYIATHGKADSFLHFGRKVSDHLKGEIYFKQFNNINSYAFELIPNQASNLIINKEDSGYGSKYSNISYYNYWDLEYNSHVLTNSTSYRDKYLRDHFRSFKIYHFHDTSRTAALRTPCNLKDNRLLKEDGSNLAAFLYLLQEKHPKSFKFITRTVQSIAPFFKGFSLEPDELSPDMIELVWEEKGSDMYLNAQNLSDGTIRFIALATLLLQPEPPSTIIIDEPELGLHPFAINKLAGLIKKASVKSQIILSTQSVNLVSNFEPESVITVDRADGQSVFKRLDSQDLKNWLEDYSLGDLWTKSVIGGQP
ncbi:AAA family ATPase [Aureispira sp. CCB-E]|uniref:AAA family ATPase n=1 Tax=Aureispira sp. CCB-E TaxID=3051121 RepID=UPI00286852DF|nr:AAA family ATPase [Aureispira sp. CCB-E]WMX16038.1 AAA family ATPase [Aureispira sp. CCB-E]